MSDILSCLNYGVPVLSVSRFPTSKQEGTVFLVFFFFFFKDIDEIIRTFLTNSTPYPTPTTVSNLKLARGTWNPVTVTEMKLQGDQ